jgi:hypothetical protein
MFRLLLWWVDSGTHRFTAVHIVMSMAAIGAVTTIVTDSIAFPVTKGIFAFSRHCAGVLCLITQ